MSEVPTLFLDRGFFPDERARCYPAPGSVVSARELQEVPELFGRLEAHLSGGGLAVGFVSFEAAQSWEGVARPASAGKGACLAWFALYDRDAGVSGDPWGSSDADGETPVQLRFRGEDPIPASSWKRVRRALEDGWSYQINLTGIIDLETALPPPRLFARLRAAQAAPYSAWLDTGAHQILSCSPELFFRRDGNAVTTQPMKGTAPRGRTPEEDLAACDRLCRDEKTQAENRMIVDLLRNDLGRLCIPGTVNVPHLFQPMALPTVWQLTSTIRGELRPGTDTTALFHALFPCGSVVGAPKASTLRLIRQLEPGPRGAYCGAIGWASADAACFNVAIRTVECRGGRYTMGVGSGLVEGSTLEQERLEWRQKTRFLLSDPSPFELFTTMRWDGRQIHYRRHHLDRLQRSAAFHGFALGHGALEAHFRSLEERLPGGAERRVKVRLARDGHVEDEVSMLLPPSGSTRVRIAGERVDSADAFLFHKTTRRRRWDAWRARAQDEGLADYLFLNERGELTEGTIHSVCVQLPDGDGRSTERLTPALACGLLPGVLRQEGLSVGELREAVITVEMLGCGARLWIGNALHPWREVSLAWN